MTALGVTYEYKIFRGGVYLGSLPSVVSPFGYSLDINNPSAPMTVECDLPVLSSSTAPTTLDTEAGIALNTEDGTDIWLESTPTIYGSSSSGALIANDNDIIVYEFSADYPSGKKVFSGWISKWQLQVVANKVVINCLSYGMDFNDYVIKTGEAVGIANANDNNSFFTIQYDGISQPQNQLQTFTMPTQQSVLYVDLETSNPGGIAVQLNVYIFRQVNSAPDQTVDVSVAGGSLTVPATESSKTVHKVSLGAGATLGTGSTYYIRVDYGGGGAGSNIRLYASSLNPYGNGKSYSGTYSFPNYIYAENVGYDLYFNIYTGGGGTTSAFTAIDPTTMFTQAVDNYSGQGGKCSYSGASIGLTGIAVSYTFIMGKMLDVAQKAIELAPANFYWTVDPATALAYFKAFSTTPDILLTLGQNIQDLQLGINAEGVRNTLYFTGGPTAGVNLLKQYSNPAGLATTGRQRLETQTDNRVTLSATADQIASAFFGANANEVYETQVTVYRNTTDLTSILPGQTIGFGGFGNFIDRLLLYVTRVERHPDYSILTLGSIPPRATSTLKDLQNRIADLETVANPTTPS